jgi:hypothetical protein
MKKLALSALLMLAATVVTYAIAVATGVIPAVAGTAVVVTCVGMSVTCAVIVANVASTGLVVFNVVLDVVAVVAAVEAAAAGAVNATYEGATAAAIVIFLVAVLGVRGTAKAHGIRHFWVITALSVEALGVGLALGLGSWLWALPSAALLVAAAYAAHRRPALFAQ